MRFQSYFNTAIKIIQLYDGNIPLQYYLKQYFSQYKKHGSKDRKFITHLCYNFYRLGKSLNTVTTEERLKLAIFICNNNAGEWSFLYNNEWLANWKNSLQQRIMFIQSKYKFLLNDVFPFADELSKGLDADAFIQSLFIQPDVFIKTRPGYYETVISKLRQHNIGFNVIDENCISLSPFINIHSIINIDEEAMIQDYSSQCVKEFIKLTEMRTENSTSEMVNRISVWDCCAGSGGKSLLAYDVLKKINLTVSDLRTSIIQNLKQRFSKANIKHYKSFICDLTQPLTKNFYLSNHESFDLIICDAPCTGSGTWSRTPEQLYFFNTEKIIEYALRQKEIISNAIQFLNNHGFFLYITCSVFSKENEDIANYIQQQFQLELVSMKLLKGYHKKADTMFAAFFRKHS